MDRHVRHGGCKTILAMISICTLDWHVHGGCKTILAMQLHLRSFKLTSVNLAQTSEETIVMVMKVFILALVSFALCSFDSSYRPVIHMWVGFLLMHIILLSDSHGSCIT